MGGDGGADCSTMYYMPTGRFILFIQDGYKRMRVLEMFPADRAPTLNGIGSEVYDEQLLDIVFMLDKLAHTGIKLQKLGKEVWLAAGLAGLRLPAYGRLHCWS